jgi:predicted transport protein
VREIGRFGTRDVGIRIDSLDNLEEAEPLIENYDAT